MNKWIAVFSFVLICQATKAQNFSAKTKYIIDSFLRITYTDSLPGATVGIIKNNSFVFAKSYGVRNLKTGEKITSSTDFNIASLTKQFTAIAILLLEEQHKLSLTDKLSRFFPDMNKKVADSITIQQLLTHSSGIRDHYDYIDTKTLKHAHNIDVYNAVKNVDSLYFKPGTKFQYSNTGYCLLALVIEKVSGISYNDYMQQNIFQPAGMKDTRIWNEQASILQPATGYDKDSITNRFMPSGANEHIFFSTEGDGGIYTSLADYIHWLSALQKENVFSKKIVDKARTIEHYIDAKSKLGYGFGWFVDESETNKKVYHSGSNGGFRTYSFTIPAENFMIVVFSNRSDIDIEETARKIYSLLFPDKKPFTKIEVLTS